MNITQIKQELGITNLPLVRNTLEGKPTVWLSYWNNLTRVMVVVHEDLLNVVADSTKLALKSSKAASKDSGEEYTKHILIEVKNEEEVVL